MLPSFANDTVVRLRAGTKTERGSSVPDWKNAVSLTIGGCSVQPASASLSQDGRVLGVLDGLTCYMPYGSDVKEGDRILWDGDEYLVNGPPRKWRGPVSISYMQVNLRRWDG